MKTHQSTTWKREIKRWWRSQKLLSQVQSKYIQREKSSKLNYLKSLILILIEISCLTMIKMIVANKDEGERHRIKCKSCLMRSKEILAGQKKQLMKSAESLIFMRPKFTSGDGIKRRNEVKQIMISIQQLMNSEGIQNMGSVKWNQSQDRLELMSIKSWKLWILDSSSQVHKTLDLSIYLKILNRKKKRTLKSIWKNLKEFFKLRPKIDEGRI